jgi:hypothetical protein
MIEIFDRAIWFVICLFRSRSHKHNNQQDRDQCRKLEDLEVVDLSWSDK